MGGHRQHVASGPGTERELLRYAGEIRLLGPVLSYWLEQRGFPALHASAIAAGPRAIAFLGRHGSGKSSLAAALVQLGYPLLTDDVLALEDRAGDIHGRPGYPQIRMWPDQALHFLGRYEDLAIVHPGYSKRRVPVGTGGFGRFHDGSLPLAAIYVAERQPAGSVEVREVSPREAFLELVRHSFTPHLVEAAGLQPCRMDLFARLVCEVPVCRLLYPGGFDHLPRIAEEVLMDLDRRGRRRTQVVGSS